MLVTDLELGQELRLRTDAGVVVLKAVRLHGRKVRFGVAAPEEVAIQLPERKAKAPAATSTGDTSG